MKKFLLSLLALLLLFSLCACVNNPTGNLPPETDPPGSSTVQDPENPYQDIYDSDNNLILDYLLDDDGSYLGKNEYTYENGKPHTQKEYDSQDRLFLSTTHEYDENGKLYKDHLELYEDGLVYAREVWEYSQTGSLSVVNYYNADGQQTDKTEYVYNDDGSLLKEVSYGYLDGRLFSRVEIDGQDLVLSEHQYDENGNVFWYIIYTYENGLRVKGTESTGCYTIYHYDGDGVEIGYTIYDADGNITEEISYK